ncbi:beta strand repeat-containing protein, partial [Nitrospirillum iridis]
SYTGVSLTSGVSGLTIAAGTQTIGSNVDLVAAAVNDYIGGTLGSLNNTGTISGVLTAAYITGTGSLGTLSNSGVLDGARFGIRNQGTIGLVANSGTATGTIGLYNQGVIGTVINTGLLQDAPVGTAAGLNNAGTIGVLTNQGTITSPVALRNSGSIGRIDNSGLIAGSLINTSANALTITGGTGTVVGSLTGTLSGTLNTMGTITSTLANVVVASGNLLLNDQVTLGSGTLVNSGASLRLTTLVSVTGSYSQSAGTLALGYGNQLAVSGAAVLTGGTVAVSGVPGTLTLLAGVGSGTALVAGGVGSSYSGLVYSADVTGMEVTGSVGGTSLFLAGLNDYVGGTLGTLSNSGTISASNAVYVAATGSLGSFSNTGVLTGANAALDNLGTIGSIANGTLGTLGVMTGGVGVANAGVIGTLVSYGTVTGTTGAGVDNQGTINALGNAGLINGATSGISNAGTVGLFVNIGQVTGGSRAIANSGSLGLLSNSGLLSGVTALYNAANATLGTVSNSGTIAGNIVNLASADLVLAGSGGTLTGGIITNTAANVVFAGGAAVIGDAINVGGHTVVNDGASLELASTLSITGNYSQASGTLALGTLSAVVSGVAAITGGTITASVSSTSNYVVGGSGGVVLVQGGSGSSYTGVSLTSGVSGLTIAAGTQTIGSNVDLVAAAVNDYIGGTLGSLNNTGTISGVLTAAYITGTGSLGTLSNSGLLDGARFGIRNQGTIGLVANSGTATGTIGLYNQGVIGTVINTGLLQDAPVGTAAGLNNAGTIGVLTNQGTITSPVALRNSGSIGRIDNSGLIAGSLINTSANALTITGGTGTVVGSLTGTLSGTLNTMGTITSTLANVVLASGNLWLNDQVTLGSGTLVNSGASLRLATIISVTGNYGQSAGTLSLGYGNQLAVSGAAVLTGGTVAVSGVPGTLNLLAGVGGGTALVAGGVGSSYSGLSYSADVTGMEVTGSVGGTSLFLAGLNDYVGGTLGNLSNSGTISASNAVYVAATGSLGSFSNTGVLTGANAALDNLGTIGSIANGTLGTLGVMTGGVGVANAGVIGTLVSYGSITGTTGAGVDNQGTINALGNAGLINGATSGISNAGTVGLFVNIGQVTGGSRAIANSGSLLVLQNAGLL